MSFYILEKFTTHLKNVLRQAAALAAVLRHEELRPEHLLYGLSKQKGSIGTEILSKAGVTPDSVKEMIIRRNAAALLAAPLGEKPEPALAQQSKRALEKAVLIANQHEHRYVGTEHLLASLLGLDDAAVHDIFRSHRVSVNELKQHLANVLKNTSKFPDLTNLFDQTKEGDEEPAPPGARQRERGSALDYFCTDLTDEHLQKNIDPVIGRDREIERMIHILSRRTKNNPVLIGDPGVGKTALVEGLAKRIVEGGVPDVLADKRIVSLDLSLVVAGTVYRGEFEGRIKQIIEEIKADPNTIVFIDELHTIIGAGGASGALDAANILKPALAKGQLRCIGATTLDEYHKHIESDAALERRFQPIFVQEPTADETMDILRGLKENYERYHRVAISEDAIRAATELSIRFLQDKFLPDKAIDLLDEAASKLRVNRKKDDVARRMDELEGRVEDLHAHKQEAVNKEDFNHAVLLKEEEERLTAELKTLKQQQSRRADRLIGPITSKDIAEVVARITGIPVGNIVEREQRRLLKLENELQRSIVGQDAVTAAIAACIRRSRTGLSSPNRPLGSFLFLGPSGVGKTETAKVLARTVFGDEKALLRFDMSEYAESFQASKLIGAPPGYVGYKEGSKLTESVKRKPYSVVLFDEVEKAHPDLFNLLLQVLDEGHLTDAVGKRINFKNTIIIMTSNLGLNQLNRQAAIGFTHPERERQERENFRELETKLLEDVKRHFRPELLNRIDKILVFQPLLPRHADAIVKMQLEELAQRLRKRNLTLDADKSVKKFLAEKGVSPEQGARRLRHVLQESVEGPLADFLLQHADEQFTTVRLTMRGDTVMVTGA